MTSRPRPSFEAIDPVTYLDLAKELASGASSAARRTAADRAYYAAFLYSCDQLAEKGYITPYYFSDDHKYVAERLKDRDVLGTFGNEETRLRNARNTVTYDTRDLSRPSLQWMIETATKIIERVRRLPRAP